MKNYKANTYVTATQVKKQNTVNTPERHHPPTAILVPLSILFQALLPEVNAGLLKVITYLFFFFFFKAF